MVEPRVVYACDHLIQEIFDEAVELKCEFSVNHKPDDLSEDELKEWDKTYICRDVVFSNKKMLDQKSAILKGIISPVKIVCSDYEEPMSYQDENAVNLPADAKLYTSSDFDIQSVFTSTGQYIYLDWKRGMNHPEGKYTAQITYQRICNEAYTASECPRCCGDGWYVGLFESGNTNATTIRDENKIVQSFFKFIYTKADKNGYGSNILSLPGKYDSSDIQTLCASVTTEISRFETHYKNQLSSMVLDGYTASDDEILRSINLLNIDTESDLNAINVKVRFYTQAGSKLDVDIVLPEDE